jgi:osmotically-inducible protein OsmY
MSNDDYLQKAVLAELSWEPSVTAAHIGVTANAGVVTLTGYVENFAEKQAAETAARRVKGVKAVAEEIEVRLSPETQRSDADIAAAAIDRLGWDVLVPPDSVKAKVEDGWVTLTGQVGWYYQQMAAEEDVRRLFGVVGVSNQTTIMPKVNTPNICDGIMHALHRSWFFDPNTIAVTAEGGKVFLAGSVDSWHDRRVAEAIAWAAPGVTAVENDIAII